MAVLSFRKGLPGGSPRSGGATLSCPARVAHGAGLWLRAPCTESTRLGKANRCLLYLVSLVYLTVVWGRTFSMIAIQASECRLRGNFAVYVRKSVFRPMLSIAFLNSFFQWLFWILSELDDGKSDLGQNICFLPVVLSVLAVSWAASTSIKEAEGAHDGSGPALEAAVRLAQLCHKTH